MLVLQTLKLINLASDVLKSMIPGKCYTSWRVKCVESFGKIWIERFTFLLKELYFKKTLGNIISNQNKNLLHKNKFTPRTSFSCIFILVIGKVLHGFTKLEISFLKFSILFGLKAKGNIVITFSIVEHIKSPFLAGLHKLFMMLQRLKITSRENAT